MAKRKREGQTVPWPREKEKGGTLYPLLLDSLGLGKISVGAPYFDAVFIPIMVPAVLAMALGGFLRDCFSYYDTASLAPYFLDRECLL